MSTNISEDKKEFLLANFIENPEFYKERDSSKVKAIIAGKYFNDYELFQKISLDNSTRQLLSSPNLLVNIMRMISHKDFKFRSETKSIDIFFLIKQFSLHEDKFITNQVASVSLEFLTFVLPTINTEIVNTDKLKKNKNGISSLYSFFERCMNKLSIKEIDKNKYQNLYNRIQQLFASNNYKSASTWFKFFFFYRTQVNFGSNIKNDQLSHITGFIRSAPNSKQMKNIIEDVLPVKDFMATEDKYSIELSNRSIQSVEFAIEFFPIFDDTKKQSILESWVQGNSENASRIINSVKDKIPNKLLLGKKIIERASRENSKDSVKKAFLDLLFTLGLTKDEISSTGYEDQVAILIFNTNVLWHKLGIDQLKNHREYIDVKSLKPKAESFLSSIINNPNSYHIQIKNLIENKLGVTKAFVDDLFANSNRHVNETVQYLINSGNLGFYKILSSKLKEATINRINTNFLTNIDKQPFHINLLKYIEKTYSEVLDENVRLKLKALLDD